MGASLVMAGAATLTDPLEKHNGSFELAFQDYNKKLFAKEMHKSGDQRLSEQTSNHTYCTNIGATMYADYVCFLSFYCKDPLKTGTKTKSLLII
jgi:hypothetical protein